MMAAQVAKSVGRAASRCMRCNAGWCQINETSTSAAVAKMQKVVKMSRDEWKAAESLLSTGNEPPMIRGATQLRYVLVTRWMVWMRWIDQVPPSWRRYCTLAHACWMPQVMAGDAPVGLFWKV